MKGAGQLFGATVGVAVGVVATMFFAGQPRQVGASSNDRYQDFAIATGMVATGPRSLTDGVWLLDYRTGKLLGTVIDRNLGKIVGWSEVDLVKEFDVAPRQDVHFMMITGNITQGQSALYVAETTTGKFGVYTMGANPTGPGVVIKRHDMTSFRKPAEQPVAQPQPQVPAQINPAAANRLGLPLPQQQPPAENR
jgi:hypothetical protein